jgi:hypothetical protein
VNTSWLRPSLGTASAERAGIAATTTAPVAAATRSRLPPACLLCTLFPRACAARQCVLISIVLLPSPRASLVLRKSPEPPGARRQGRPGTSTAR